MLNFLFLTPDFYSDYADCKEIERKVDRPYIQVEVLIDGILFAVPLRSGINHPHVLWTDKANHCGVDFSKAVVVTDRERYIDKSRKPHIRENEFEALRGKDHQVKMGLKKYIQRYLKAKSEPNIPRNKWLLRCSTLQYFEKYLT